MSTYPNDSREAEAVARSMARGLSGRLGMTALRPMLARLGMIVVLAACLLWLVMSIVHVDDRHALNLVSGTWMALAERASEGELYPLLFDGEHTGGTRYMPVIPLLHALVSRGTGELLISGKLVSYASGVFMAAMLFIWLRRRSGDALLAALLCTAVVATPAGIVATLGMRGDALSIALQLAAMVLVAAPRSAQGKAPGEDAADPDLLRSAVAALLCALALLCKVTALWAPVAIVLWLLQQRRFRSAAIFAGTWFALAGGGVLIFNAISEGRMLAQLGAFSSEGNWRAGTLLLGAPTRLIEFAAQAGPSTWMLAPFALLAMIQGVRTRAATPALLAMVLGLGGLTLLYADAGIGENHVILVLVLLALGAGEFLAYVRAAHQVERELSHVVMLAAAMTSTIIGIVPPTSFEARRALGWERDAAIAPLDGIVDSDAMILSDDPYIALSLGRRPVVLDAYLLPRMHNSAPEAIAFIRESLEQQRFDVLAMTHPIDLGSAWFGVIFFGPELSAVMLEHYEFEGVRNGHCIYRPK